MHACAERRRIRARSVDLSCALQDARRDLQYGCHGDMSREERTPWLASTSAGGAHRTRARDECGNTDGECTAGSATDQGALAADKPRSRRRVPYVEGWTPMAIPFMPCRPSAVGASERPACLRSQTLRSQSPNLMTRVALHQAQGAVCMPLAACHRFHGRRSMPDAFRGGGACRMCDRAR